MTVFPPIPLAEWVDTKETPHRFLQIVGKLRLASAPRRNHESAYLAGARRAGRDLDALRCPTAPDHS